MSGRFWFYLGSAIVIAGLFSWYVSNQNSITLQMTRLEEQGRSVRLENLDGYLAKETDERKLVSLAKLLRHEEPLVLKPIIERAYELNPNSRDIALLASEFHPELNEKIKTLDPLYKTGD